MFSYIIITKIRHFTETDILVQIFIVKTLSNIAFHIYLTILS
jgi:hypothetical protein